MANDNRLVELAEIDRQLWSCMYSCAAVGTEECSEVADRLAGNIEIIQKEMISIKSKTMVGVKAKFECVRRAQRGMTIREMMESDPVKDLDDNTDQGLMASAVDDFLALFLSWVPDNANAQRWNNLRAAA